MDWLTECPSCASTKILRWGKRYLVKRDKPRDLRDAENQILLGRLQRKSLVRQIYLCLSCSFLFQNPTYDARELQQIYGEAGPKSADYCVAFGKSAKDLWDSPVARKNLTERQFTYAEEIMASGASKILDYGGGSGINLQHSLLNHTKRYVYDFGKDSVSEKGMISIKSLETEKCFDFILHTHVLEHEPDPRSSLKKLRQLIAPNGTLYLEVPFDYTERIISRRPGAIWHVNHFNRKTIVEVGMSAGWRCKEIRVTKLPYSHLFLNCIVAILKPDLDGSQHKRPVKIINVGFDMLWTLIKRAQSSSGLSRLFRVFI